MRTTRWVALLLMLLAALALGACGDDDDDDGGGGATTTEQTGGGIQKDDANASTKIVVGSKNFTEQKLLGEIYAQGLAAAGYTVEKDLNLGDEKIAFRAIETNQINAYPEYTGTALLSLFGVKADKLPTDPQVAFEDARRDYAEKGMTAYEPTPYTNSNEVAVTQETADEYGLQKISDLSKVADQLTLYGTPECRQRLDCLLGLQQVYGLKFKRFVPVDPALRHEVLTCRSCSRPTPRTRVRTSCCSRTTSRCSRPTTRRSSCATTSRRRAARSCAGSSIRSRRV
jgi:osmoprotectant transport system substrate-binding protein